MNQKFIDLLHLISESVEPKAGKRVDIKDVPIENTVGALEAWARTRWGYMMAKDTITTVVDTDGDIICIHYINWTKDIATAYRIKAEAKEIEHSMEHFKKFNDGLTWKFAGKQMTDKYAKEKYPMYCLKVA